MTINLDTLNAKELDALISAANEQKKRIERDRVNEVRRKLTAIAKDEGFSIEELFGNAPSKPQSKTAGRTVAIKYRNPADTTLTWTGRGKQPRWLAAEVAKGKNAADFLVQ